MDQELRDRLSDIMARVNFFGWAMLAVLERQFGKPWMALVFFLLALLSCVARVRFEGRFWSKVWNR